MPVYKATKWCLEVFRKKNKDLIKDQIAAFIGHHYDIHIYK